MIDVTFFCKNCREVRRGELDRDHFSMWFFGQAEAAPLIVCTECGTQYKWLPSENKTKEVPNASE